MDERGWTRIPIALNLRREPLPSHATCHSPAARSFRLSFRPVHRSLAKLEAKRRMEAKAGHSSRATRDRLSRERRSWNMSSHPRQAHDAGKSCPFPAPPAGLPLSPPRPHPCNPRQRLRAGERQKAKRENRFRSLNSQPKTLNHRDVVSSRLTLSWSGNALRFLSTAVSGIGIAAAKTARRPRTGANGG